MQKVSYMGNGTTTEFFFNFPYFENSNIVVTVNNAPAPAYNVIGTPAGSDADIPFNGGKVVFDVAPATIDSIVIARNLPLARPVDYQPTAKIDATTLNQDFNYLIEVIKDRKDELNNLYNQYSDIADKESTATLLARISAIHDEIVAVTAQIQELGDMSHIRANIATLQTTVANQQLWCDMPGTRFVNLDTENNGTFIAPENGYIWLQAGQTSNAQLFVDVQDKNGELLYCCGGILNFGSVLAPIAKGNVAIIRYTAKQFLRFIYAINAPAQ